MKHILKQALLSRPALYRAVRNTQYSVTTFFRLRYFATDLLMAFKHYRWPRHHRLSDEQLTAKILFYYHKIEKGLSMPGVRRLFGLEVVEQVQSLLNEWDRRNMPDTHSVYLGATHAIVAYRDRIVELDDSGGETVLASVDAFLTRKGFADLTPDTPVFKHASQTSGGIAFESFFRLCTSRRSFRDFLPMMVDREVLIHAIESAQLSPSACNRQPCRVYVFDGARKAELLEYQNGNKGFGHLAPQILMITASMHCYLDARERHQPYIDAGLFTMSLLFGLQTQKVVSCCLNWCVPTSTDKQVHREFDIPSEEKIAMLVAIGYPAPITPVPKSHRKPASSLLVYK